MNSGDQSSSENESLFNDSVFNCTFGRALLNRLKVPIPNIDGHGKNLFRRQLPIGSNLRNLNSPEIIATSPGTSVEINGSSSLSESLRNRLKVAEPTFKKKTENLFRKSLNTKLLRNSPKSLLGSSVCHSTPIKPSIQEFAHQFSCLNESSIKKDLINEQLNNTKEELVHLNSNDLSKPSRSLRSKNKNISIQTSRMKSTRSVKDISVQSEITKRPTRATQKYLNTPKPTYSLRKRNNSAQASNDVVRTPHQETSVRSGPMDCPRLSRELNNLLNTNNSINLSPNLVQRKHSFNSTNSIRKAAPNPVSVSRNSNCSPSKYPKRSTLLTKRKTLRMENPTDPSLNLRRSKRTPQPRQIDMKQYILVTPKRFNGTRRQKTIQQE